MTGTNRILKYDIVIIILFIVSQKTTTQGPLHLMKMEFKLHEEGFYQNLKEIEKELNSEIQALNKNEDIHIIINRNAVS